MSGRKPYLPPYQLFGAADMSQATLTSPTTDVSGFDNVKLWLVYSGSAVGTFTVNTSPDNGTTWFPFTLAPAPVASGSGGKIQINFNQLPDPKIQIVYTKTSGTGSLTGWIAAKGL